MEHNWKNPSLENPKYAGNYFISFCWQGVALQKPVKTDAGENCSVWREKCLESGEK